MSINTPIEATVVEVRPSDVRETDSFTGKRYELGNYVVVEDKDGARYTFLNGSLNQVKPEDRVVGRRGTVRWIRSTSFNLPIFEGETIKQ